MNAQLSRIGVIVLLLAVLLVPAIATAQEPPPAPPQPQIPENEPNDSFSEHEYLSLDTRRHGRIDPAGDRDVYRMWMYPPVYFHLDVRLPDSSPLTPVIAIYDQWENLLEEHECPRSGRCLTYEGPSGEYGEGDLYIVITDGQGNASPAYEYSFTVVTAAGATDPNEPNDFISEATPYTIGEEMVGLMELEGDIDTFSFHLEAGNEVIFKGHDLDTLFLNAAGQVLDGSDYGQPIYTAPESGTYYIQIIAGPSVYQFVMSYTQRPIYASFSGAGKLDGVAFKPGDILVYTSLDDTWRMWFRAADYGLKGNLAAFDRTESSLFLTYATPQNVPGVGPIAPHDVLYYYPGNPEWGEEPLWQLAFDGSQVGLTTTSERIDALAVEYDWYTARYHLSIRGKGQLPFGGGQWHFANNDVMAYEGHLENGQMSGQYRASLGGQAAGFGRANVVGLDLAEDGRFLSFDRPLTLDGETFAPGDIAFCTFAEEYGDYGCGQVTKIFDASNAGVAGYKIDGIDVGVYVIP